MTLPLLFVVGDSISIQYGPYLERATAGRFAYDRKGGPLARDASLDEPQDANGGDSRMVAAYLERIHAQGAIRPHVLLLNCGLHDIKTDPQTGERQVPPDAYVANLGRIFALAREISRFTIWVRTTPVVDDIHNARSTAFKRFAADVDRYNALADAACAERQIPQIDLWAFTRSLGAPDELFCDHVHYVESVRAQQAAFIAGALWYLAPAR